MHKKIRKKQEEYAELLKKPQWQKRRLQMLEKAGWKCVKCSAEESQLHVHHRRYVYGAKPWEYEDEDLLVLCERCHNKAHGIESTTSEDAFKPASAMESLLGVILYRPDLVTEIPMDLLPKNQAESAALKEIYRLSGLGEGLSVRQPKAVIGALGSSGYLSAAMGSYVRAMPHFAEDGYAKAIIRDVLRKLRTDVVTGKISAILDGARNAPLSDDGRAALSELLMEKRALAQAFDGEEDARKRGWKADLCARMDEIRASHLQMLARTL